MGMPTMRHWRGHRGAREREVVHSVIDQRLRGPRYDITAERWTVRARGDPLGPDFLELSVTAEPVDAALVQPAFLATIRGRGVDPDAFQQTKTRHGLQYLAALGPA